MRHLRPDAVQYPAFRTVCLRAQVMSPGHDHKSNTNGTQTNQDTNTKLSKR